MAFGPLSLAPTFVVKILREAGRHILRHPVPGVAACAHTDDGRWVLIRRADTGTWALPGGTLEWGETLAVALARELEEEAGINSCQVESLVGVFSDPDRDPRFHAVTTVVRCLVVAPTKPPQNPLEIREVGLFRTEDLPKVFAMGMRDMIDRAIAGNAAHFE